MFFIEKVTQLSETTLYTRCMTEKNYKTIATLQTYT